MNNFSFIGLNRETCQSYITYNFISIAEISIKKSIIPLSLNDCYLNDILRSNIKPIKEESVIDYLSNICDTLRTSWYCDGLGKYIIPLTSDIIIPPLLQSIIKKKNNDLIIYKQHLCSSDNYIIELYKNGKILLEIYYTKNNSDPLIILDEEESLKPSDKLFIHISEIRGDDLVGRIRLHLSSDYKCDVIFGLSSVPLTNILLSEKTFYNDKGDKCSYLNDPRIYKNVKLEKILPMYNNIMYEPDIYCLYIKNKLYTSLSELYDDLKETYPEIICNSISDSKLSIRIPNNPDNLIDPMYADDLDYYNIKFTIKNSVGSLLYWDNKFRSNTISKLDFLKTLQNLFPLSEFYLTFQ